MKLWKKLSLLVVAVLCITALVVTASAAEVDSGTCGDNLTWVLYDNGELVIEGTGPMANWTSAAQIQWLSHRSDVKTLTLPEGMTSIGSYAFYYFKNLESVTIPENVTSIGKYAFNYCQKLTSVTIPDKVTTISDFAFSGCKGLTTVTLGAGVNYIGGNTFYGCVGLTEFVVDAANGSFSADDNGVLFNKSMTTLINYPSGKTQTEYTVPDGVTTIGNKAFESCTSLESVTIPDGVTTIGDSAFDGCTNLTSVTIPDSVTTIGSYAFEDSTNLTIYCSAGSVAATYAANNGHASATPRGILSSGTCGDNLTWVLYEDGELVIEGTGAMTDWIYAAEVPWHSHRSNIKTVTIGNGVTSIGSYAFRMCSNLTSVTIPDSVTHIGYEAFYKTSLTSVTFPNSVITIDEYAFYACSDLTSVTIPDSVITIGNSAFSGCNDLQSVTIGAGVTSIGRNAFLRCFNLPGIVVDGANESYSSDENGVLFNKSMTTLLAYPGGREQTSYSIPAGVTIIEELAFYDCDTLQSVTIPDSTTTIGYAAFDSCTNLTSVTIPAGVTTIGEDAFYNCPNLTIYAYAGSTAETYAADNGHPFVDITPRPVCELVDGTNTVIGTYSSMEEAVNSLTAGSTLRLTDNATVATLAPTAGTVDLNGFTLTAENVAIAPSGTAYMIDSDGEARGLLKCEGLVELSKTNKAFPVWDGALGGYRFFDFNIRTQVTPVEGWDSMKVRFYFGKTLDWKAFFAYLGDGTTDNNVTIGIRFAHDGGTIDAKFNDTLAAIFAQQLDGGYAVGQCNVTNASKKQNLTYAVVLKSTTTGAEYVVNAATEFEVSDLNITYFEDNAVPFA